MSNEERIEAAAQKLWIAWCANDPPWDRLPEADRARWRCDAEMIVEAAVPELFDGSGGIWRKRPTPPPSPTAPASETPAEPSSRNPPPRGREWPKPTRPGMRSGKEMSGR